MSMNRPELLSGVAGLLTFSFGFALAFEDGGFNDGVEVLETSAIGASSFGGRPRFLGDPPSVTDTDVREFDFIVGECRI